MNGRPPGGYIDALDGIRAVAALLVVVFHTWIVLQPHDVPLLATIARSGWLGVDLFFTLSGFLITRILLGSRDDPSYFRAFYMRRVLRIFPLYYCLLTLIFATRAIAGTPSGAPWWTAMLFVSNHWLAVGAHDDVAIEVTWSLAVEEQFYALWPVLVWLLRRRGLYAVVVGAVLLAPLARYAVHEPGSAGSYMYALCRVDALAFGALGALWIADGWHRALAWARRLAVPAALVLVGLLFAPFTDQSRYDFATVGYSVVGACAGLLVAALATGGVPALGRLLANPVLAHIGRVSYGLYLLHPVVIVGLHQLSTSLGLAPPQTSLGHALLVYAVVLVASLAVATLVFRTIEAPMLALKDRLVPHGPRLVPPVPR